jgi:RNA polymerase sigma factor (sigma-70 family)
MDRLGRLYETHAPAATRLAYLLTGDRELARDLAQDAFVRVAGRFAGLRAEGNFEAYLRATVYNLVRSHFRRLKVERRHLEEEAGRAGPRDEPGPELRSDLAGTLDDLPVRQRPSWCSATTPTSPNGRRRTRWDARSPPSGRSRSGLWNPCASRSTRRWARDGRPRAPSTAPGDGRGVARGEADGRAHPAQDPRPAVDAGRGHDRVAARGRDHRLRADALRDARPGRPRGALGRARPQGVRLDDSDDGRPVGGLRADGGTHRTRGRVRRRRGERARRPDVRRRPPDRRQPRGARRRPSCGSVARPQSERGRVRVPVHVLGDAHFGTGLQRRRAADDGHGHEPDGRRARLRDVVRGARFGRRAGRGRRGADRIGGGRRRRGDRRWLGVLEGAGAGSGEGPRRSCRRNVQLRARRRLRGGRAAGRGDGPRLRLLRGLRAERGSAAARACGGRGHGPVPRRSGFVAPGARQARRGGRRRHPRVVSLRRRDEDRVGVRFRRGDAGRSKGGPTRGCSPSRRTT